MVSRRQLTDAERGLMRVWLDDLYVRYHNMDHLGSDPLQFVHRYSDPSDQEITGLIAASLAYGNVTSINRSIADVLRRMPVSPFLFLRENTDAAVRRAMRGFRHRWTGESEICDLLLGIRAAVMEAGGLGTLFKMLDEPGTDLSAGLTKWVRVLQGSRPKRRKELLSDPSKSSACKRLHLYMRWMVRKDEIDPGCWAGIDPARLVIPLDTHIFGFAKAYGFTRRASADGLAAREITGVFRLLRPDDPVQYDFCLTRPGIIDGWRPGSKPPWCLK